MKFFVFFFVVFCCNASYAQLATEFDTLTYFSRMNSSIDSIDISSANLPSTFDGGIALTSPNGLSVNNLLANYTTPNFLPNSSWSKMQFSALPHLGFSYSFGGQGAQFLKAKYNHAFTDSMILQINYARRSGTGSIRNGNFGVDDLTAQFQKLGKFYSLHFKGSFHGATINHPGGITTDSLIENFGLEFSPVFKSNANSKSRVGELHLKNYFDFNKDSLRSLGLITRHDYTIKNRVFLEQDTIFGLYPSVYIDSFATRDQFNLASLANGAGVFAMSKRFYLDALIDYNYWNYQNLAQHKDTSEVSLSSVARLHLKSLNISNNLYFNLIGAFNAFKNSLQLSYEDAKIQANGSFVYEQKAPTPFQRKYFSNTNNYQLSSISLQQWMNSQVNVKYQFKPSISVSLLGEFASINSVYQYNGSQWVNNSINATYASVGVRSALQFGVLNIHPRFVYSASQDSLLPKYQASTRLFIKGKLFKDKKLDAVFGVDVSYISGFRTKYYLPSMDTYDWALTGKPFTEQTNLHAFLSLGISEFRFFFRYENIGYFWSNKSSEVMANYPIASPRMRIGLTWDFFN